MEMQRPWHECITTQSQNRWTRTEHLSSLCFLVLIITSKRTSCISCLAYICYLLATVSGYLNTFLKWMGTVFGKRHLWKIYRNCVIVIQLYVVDFFSLMACSYICALLLLTDCYNLFSMMEIFSGELHVCILTDPGTQLDIRRTRSDLERYQDLSDISFIGRCVVWGINRQSREGCSGWTNA